MVSKSFSGLVVFAALVGASPSQAQLPLLTGKQAVDDSYTGYYYSYVGFTETGSYYGELAYLYGYYAYYYAYQGYNSLLFGILDPNDYHASYEYGSYAATYGYEHYATTGNSDAYTGYYYSWYGQYYAHLSEL